MNQVVAPTAMKITTDTATSTLAAKMTTSQPKISQGSPARVPAVNAGSFTTSGKTCRKNPRALGMLMPYRTKSRL